jgi:hypothetical protein
VYVLNYKLQLHHVIGFTSTLGNLYITYLTTMYLTLTYEMCCSRVIRCILNILIMVTVVTYLIFGYHILYFGQPQNHEQKIHGSQKPNKTRRSSFLGGIRIYPS